MQDLGPEQRERLARRFGRSFKSGEVIFREGEPASEAYWLQQGRVRLVKRVRGMERTLMTLHEHDLYGETALLPGSVRGATAIAIDDGEHWVLKRDTLMRTLEGNSETAMKLILQLVRRLREAEDQIELMMVSDAETKVVGAVLKLAKAQAEGGIGPVTLKVSPIELSARLGVDVNTVRAAVMQLRQQNYVQVVNESLQVPRIDALSNLYALLTMKDEIRGKQPSSSPPARRPGRSPNGGNGKEKNTD